MAAKKAILWGCGAVLGIFLLGAAAIGLLVWHVSQDPEGVVVEVTGPHEVEMGATFELEVLVKNERKAKNLKVQDIDIADEYLAGFTVDSTKPKYKSTMHVPIDNSQSFTFNATVPPGKTNKFVFTLRAVKDGIYRGDVDVMEGTRFVTGLAQTVVKEKQ